MAKKDTAAPTDEFCSMVPGDRIQFRCNACVSDFQITYEPTEPKAPRQEARHCPFCGEQALEYE